MSRLLEGVFVIGCSLVGFAMSSPEAGMLRNAMKTSVQLVALAQDNVRLCPDLSKVPVEILSGLRIE